MSTPHVALPRCNPLKGVDQCLPSSLQGEDSSDFTVVQAEYLRRRGASRLERGCFDRPQSVNCYYRYSAFPITKLLAIRFKRIMSDRIRALASRFPVLLLTGARQVGKATLLRQQVPAYNYVTLDLYQMADLAENKAKLFRNFKVVIDSNRSAMGHFILRHTCGIRVRQQTPSTARKPFFQRASSFCQWVDKR